MRQKGKVFSVSNLTILLTLACTLAFLTSCVAPFSDIQSAKLLGNGNFEVTPSYSSVSVSSEGETEHVQNHVGVQVGYGVLKFMDLRMRYERITGDIDEEESFGVNVFGFGPKFRLAKNWLALYVPIGFAFGNEIEVADTWQVHPTLLATWALGKSFEINPSAKVMIPLRGGEMDTLYAFNLGTAISTDVSKWAIRPEIGICTNFEGGHFMHFSIGFSVSSELFKK